MAKKISRRTSLSTGGQSGEGSLISENSTTMIEDERGRIDYEETGDGPALVLVPGSCSTGAAWRPVVAQWNSSFRCVTTSLLGYGGTAERRTTDDADISH
jgi:pimeloyl-ACP methyl ester carboxylesterase